MVHRGDRTNSCVQRGLSTLPFVQRWTCLDRYKFGPSASKTNISDSCRKIRGGQQETGVLGAEGTLATPISRPKPRHSQEGPCHLPPPSSAPHLRFYSYSCYEPRLLQRILVYKVLLLAFTCSSQLFESQEVEEGPWMTLSALPFISSLNLG